MASVWTNAQFLHGTALRGNTLGLRIAAGNVPNFVDLATGGYGAMIQDGFNSTQTPTMASFATLANVLAGCLTRVKQDACDRVFAAATGWDGRRRPIHLPPRFRSHSTWRINRNVFSRCWMRSIR